METLVTNWIWSYLIGMTTPDKYGCDSRDVTYTLSVIHRNGQDLTSMVSCQKGPTHHAYAWQIGPF